MKKMGKYINIIALALSRFPHVNGWAVMLCDDEPMGCKKYLKCGIEIKETGKIPP